MGTITAEDQCERQIRGNQKKGDGGSEESEAIGAFAVEGPMVVGSLQARGNRVQCAKPTSMVL